MPRAKHQVVATTLKHCKGRLQLPPPHPLAQDFVAPNPGRSLPRTFDQSSLKLRFFTDDDFLVDLPHYAFQIGFIAFAMAAE